MKYKPVLLFAFLFMAMHYSSSLFGQLAGTYTVGTDSSDFPDPDSAIQALHYSGVAGNVTFLLSHGNYTSISLVNIENDSGYRITFEGEVVQEDSAVIYGGIHVLGTSDVSFRKITILPYENQDFPAVKIEYSDAFILDSCHVFNRYFGNFEQPLIWEKFYYEGPNYWMKIINSVLSSDDKTVITEGKGKVTLKGNVIYGGLKFGYQPWSHVIDNDLYLHVDFHGFRAEEFRGNRVYYFDTEHYGVAANCYDNIFYVGVNLQSGHVIGNVFKRYVVMAYITNGKVNHNKFYGTFKNIYCNNMKIMDNRFYSDVSITNDATVFGNNWVFDTLSFTHGPGQLIYHNNFGPDAYLEMIYTSGRVINNNLSNMHILQPDVTPVENNNFIHLHNGNVNFYGINPVFYDPMYESDTVLRAVNQALVGKGKKPLSYFRYDMDSVLRGNNPAVGAQEICFDGMQDTVTVRCHDSLCLNLCSGMPEGGYWSPGYLFNDSTASQTVLYPGDPVMIYLMNDAGIPLDSVMVNTGMVRPVADVSFSADGKTVRFHNHSICADSFEWNFGDGESSGEFEPVHEYKNYGTYQCYFKAMNETAVAYGTLYIILDGEQEPARETFSVYPNPAITGFTVKSDKELQKVLLFNSEGRIIPVNIQINGKWAFINTSLLPRGFFLVLAVDRDGRPYKQRIILE